MKNLETYIDYLIDKLPIGETLDDQELVERSGEFLQGLAHLINAKRDLDENIIKTKTLRDTAYATSLNGVSGSNAQTRGANADADPLYQKARESYERADAEHVRLQGLIKVMEHAHVFYRQMRSANSKGAL